MIATLYFNPIPMFLKINRSKTSAWKISESKLLCKSVWDKDKKQSRTKTVLNISLLPISIQTMIEQSLSSWIKIDLDSISIDKSTDYWFFYVILSIMSKLKIDQLFKFYFKEDAKYIILMVIWKIITKWSKVSIVNWIKRERDLANKIWIRDEELLKLSEKKLYSLQGDIDIIQSKMEKKWNMYHKEKINKVYLYDVTSFYFEWDSNELSAYWYNRDKKKWKKIITAWLVTNEDWFPLKFEILKWNINDHKTINSQIQKIKQEFWASEIVFVWDRWMKIRYNLEDMTLDERTWVDYISGLSLNEIKSLEKTWDIQLSLFDKELQEVEVEEKDENWNKTWKKIRYILCINPVLEAEKGLFRHEMKSRFEEEIYNIKSIYDKKTEKCSLNKEKIKNWITKKEDLKTQLTEKEIDSWKYRIRKAQERYKMTKIYTISITKKYFTITFNEDVMEKIWKYDWKYVFETTASKEKFNKEEVRATYKKLQKIEHAFNIMKTRNLNLRPIFHINANTTRSHCFIWMFAYAVINDIELSIEPWLKLKEQMNKHVSVKDVIAELWNIKLTTMSIWKIGHKELRVSNINDNQKTILKYLWINQPKS